VRGQRGRRLSGLRALGETGASAQAMPPEDRAEEPGRDQEQQERCRQNR
jgi:hypothetical protein